MRRKAIIVSLQYACMSKEQREKEKNEKLKAKKLLNNLAPPITHSLTRLSLISQIPLRSLSLLFLFASHYYCCFLSCASFPSLLTYSCSTRSLALKKLLELKHVIHSTTIQYFYDFISSLFTSCCCYFSSFFSTVVRSHGFFSVVRRRNEKSFFSTLFDWLMCT